MAGAFTVERNSDGYHLRTYDDFFFDGAAPQPAWALGHPDQPPFPALLEGSVWQKLDPFVPLYGPVHLSIPNKVPVSTARAIIIWCMLCDAPLGEGSIQRL